MGLYDGPGQIADAKARLDQLHGHGRVIALTHRVGGKALALALVDQVAAIAPQIVAAQKTHGHILQQLDGDAVLVRGRVQLRAHDQLQRVLAQDLLVEV